MKKTNVPDAKAALKLSDPDTISDEILPEYRFDYRKARPNRFVNVKTSPKTIELADDVAAVFTTAESVNTILRALIHAMKQASHSGAA